MDSAVFNKAAEFCILAVLFFPVYRSERKIKASH